MNKRVWQYARIGKTYDFSAAHHLPNVADGHPCKRMHGHNYVVEIEVRGDVSGNSGFCNGVDFLNLDGVVKPIIASLDHICLNELIPNPTAENIAGYILKEVMATSAKYIYSVKVWETPKCWAMAINADGLFHAVHKE